MSLNVFMIYKIVFLTNVYLGRYGNAGKFGGHFGDVNARSRVRIPSKTDISFFFLSTMGQLTGFN
jgi:hypothetical protein